MREANEPTASRSEPSVGVRGDYLEDDAGRKRVRSSTVGNKTKPISSETMRRISLCRYNLDRWEADGDPRNKPNLGRGAKRIGRSTSEATAGSSEPNSGRSEARTSGHATAFGARAKPTRNVPRESGSTKQSQFRRSPKSASRSIVMISEIHSLNGHRETKPIWRIRRANHTRLSFGKSWLNG